MLVHNMGSGESRQWHIMMYGRWCMMMLLTPGSAVQTDCASDYGSDRHILQIDITSSLIACGWLAAERMQAQRPASG